MNYGKVQIDEVDHMTPATPDTVELLPATSILRGELGVVLYHIIAPRVEGDLSPEAKALWPCIGVGHFSRDMSLMVEMATEWLLSPSPKYLTVNNQGLFMLLLRYAAALGSVRPEVGHLELERVKLVQMEAGPADGPLKRILIRLPPGSVVDAGKLASDYLLFLRDGETTTIHACLPGVSPPLLLLNPGDRWHRANSGWAVRLRGSPPDAPSMWSAILTSNEARDRFQQNEYEREAYLLQLDEALQRTDIQWWSWIPSLSQVFDLLPRGMQLDLVRGLLPQRLPLATAPAASMLVELRAQLEEMAKAQGMEVRRITAQDLRAMYQAGGVSWEAEEPPAPKTKRARRAAVPSKGGTQASSDGVKE